MRKKYLTILIAFLLLISVSINCILYNSLSYYKKVQYEIDLHFKGSITALSTILNDSKFDNLDQISIPVSEKIYTLAYYSSYKKNENLLKALGKLDYICKNKPIESISRHKLEILKFLRDICENPLSKSASDSLLDVLNKIDSNQ